MRGLRGGWQGDDPDAGFDARDGGDQTDLRAVAGMAAIDARHYALRRASGGGEAVSGFLGRAHGSGGGVGFDRSGAQRDDDCQGVEAGAIVGVACYPGVRPSSS